MRRAVGRPCRQGRGAPFRRETTDAAGPDVDDVDRSPTEVPIPIGRPVGHEGNRPSVGRPGGRGIAGIAVGQLPCLTALGADQPQVGMGARVVAASFELVAVAPDPNDAPAFVALGDRDRIADPGRAVGHERDRPAVG